MKARMQYGQLQKRAAGNWSSHKDSRQGAALAYYSVFSLGPIIVIAIAVAGFFFGREAVSGEVASSIKDMLGAKVHKPFKPCWQMPVDPERALSRRCSD
jgi:uncharacterized BrkB/YihY/UPF0761 family membrane protein